MQFVALNNNTHEVDYYGYAEGSRLDTELMSSRGAIACVLRRRIYGREPVVEASLRQSGKSLLSNITLFRATVYLRQAGASYQIIQPHGDGYCNAFWKEIEWRLSNIIVVNE
jgi:hypothetical protein